MNNYLHRWYWYYWQRLKGWFRRHFRKNPLTREQISFIDQTIHKELEKKYGKYNNKENNTDI